MLIPTTVPNLMKFGSSILQGRWGIGKGKLFFSWQWHHLPPNYKQCPQKSQEHNLVFTRLCDKVTSRDQSCAAKQLRKYRWHNAFFPLSFQQICARCVNIDNFSGAQLKAQYRFLFDGWIREGESVPGMVFTGNVCLCSQICQSRARNPKFPIEPLIHPLFWT